MNIVWCERNKAVHAGAMLAHVSAGTRRKAEEEKKSVAVERKVDNFRPQKMDKRGK
jgi:hypothetical protein